MKHCILFTLFALYGMFANAQRDTANDAIIDFARASLGKRIGTGMCFDLVREAVERKNQYFYDAQWTYRDFFVVSIDSVQAGDVVMFDKVDFPYGGYYKNHIAIVNGVLNAGQISVIEQNVSLTGEYEKIKYYGHKYRLATDSKVTLTILDLRTIKKGKVTFYHF